MSEQPNCNDCQTTMTPENSRVCPELFLCDKCGAKRPEVVAHYPRLATNQARPDSAGKEYRKITTVRARRHMESQPCVIHTLEGDLTVQQNDWVLTGVNGEQYPCKAAIFAKTYELVSTTSHSEEAGRLADALEDDQYPPTGSNHYDAVLDSTIAFLRSLQSQPHPRSVEQGVSREAVKHARERLRNMELLEDYEERQAWLDLVFAQCLDPTSAEPGGGE